ncbi:MAG: extracellular solute-binding protein, partial [Janthinobacterium sp.]
MTAVAWGALMSAGFADASAQSCSVPVIKVLAQKSLGLTVMEKTLAEYEKKNGTKVQISYFGENDRRSKARLDASTKAGSYQIYYIDEANVAEFATAGWVVPLLKYLPKDADYDDFLPGRRAVASYKGVAYFAPLIGGSDFLFYRRDLLEKAGIAVPKTLDELVAAVKKLNSPPNVYGWAARGQRGSGMNVWRWSPFMLAAGGKWEKDGVPTFNSPQAVKATTLYRDLFKYSPPGGATYDWSNALEAFRSGKVAFMI